MHTVNMWLAISADCSYGFYLLSFITCVVLCWLGYQMYGEFWKILTTLNLSKGRNGEFEIVISNRANEISEVLIPFRSV